MAVKWHPYDSQYTSILLFFYIYHICPIYYVQNENDLPSHLAPIHTKHLFPAIKLSHEWSCIPYLTIKSVLIHYASTCTTIGLYWTIVWIYPITAFVAVAAHKSFVHIVQLLPSWIPFCSSFPCTRLPLLNHARYHHPLLIIYQSSCTCKHHFCHKTLTLQVCYTILEQHCANSNAGIEISWIIKMSHRSVTTRIRSLFIQHIDNLYLPSINATLFLFQTTNKLYSTNLGCTRHCASRENSTECIKGSLVIT